MCTACVLKSTDKNQSVFGRTMEWGAFDLPTDIMISTKGNEYVSILEGNIEGKKWSNNIGFAAFKSLRAIIGDGMNNAGLTVGVLYHPGTADYEDYNPYEKQNSINAQDLAPYLLSTCSTLEDVVETMKHTHVVGKIDEHIQQEVPFHFIVTDRLGKSKVIEFINKKTVISDNPANVLTNSPSFDWHITNLRNYLTMSNDAYSIDYEGIQLTELGHGSGMLGLPGDFTPPSRFVRAFAWQMTARPLPTSAEAVYELFRILDNFDVPAVITEDPKDQLRSSTAYTSAYDKHNLIIYYHTLNNRRVRGLRFSDIDFEEYQVEKSIHLDKVPEQDVEYLDLN